MQVQCAVIPCRIGVKPRLPRTGSRDYFGKTEVGHGVGFAVGSGHFAQIPGYPGRLRRTADQNLKERLSSHRYDPFHITPTQTKFITIPRPRQIPRRQGRPNVQDFDSRWNAGHQRQSRNNTFKASGHRYPSPVGLLGHQGIVIHHQANRLAQIGGHVTGVYIPVDQAFEVQRLGLSVGGEGWCFKSPVTYVEGGHQVGEAAGYQKSVVGIDRIGVVHIPCLEANPRQRRRSRKVLTNP